MTEQHGRPKLTIMIKQREKKNGGVMRMDPLYMVEIQLNTFMALGMATTKVKREKTKTARSLIPLVNM